MNRKNKFLSIGEMAEFTGTSIFSLRYYERIKLLEPAFTAPDSGYRYYSFDQIYLVEIIRVCVELDIPLKELTKFIGEDEIVDFWGILAYGKAIAQEKLQTIQKGLKFIQDVEQKIAFTELCQQGQKIYSREVPKMFFCVTPYKNSFKDADPLEVVKAALKLHYYEDDYTELLYAELLEFGFLCQHTPSKTRRYIYTELPEYMVKDIDENIMIIPAGAYLCTQSEESRIEQAPVIFSDYLKDMNSFLAIETSIFTGRYKVNKPIHELRIIEL